MIKNKQPHASRLVIKKNYITTIAKTKLEFLCQQKRTTAFLTA